MSINYFEVELYKVQKRFNEIFGDLIVCNLKMRQALILAISWLGVLKNKIDTGKNKEVTRENIGKFVTHRNRINKIFDRIEGELRQRRKHGNSKNTGVPISYPTERR